MSKVPLCTGKLVPLVHLLDASVSKPVFLVPVHPNSLKAVVVRPKYDVLNRQRFSLFAGVWRREGLGRRRRRVGAHPV